MTIYSAILIIRPPAGSARSAHSARPTGVARLTSVANPMGVARLTGVAHPTGVARLTSVARLASLAVAALAAVVAAGCGSGSSGSSTLNVVPAEHAIASSVLSNHGVHATVTCPSNVPERSGQTFTCTAHLQAGAYPVTVTETNGSGHVRYENKQPLVVLNIAKVERAIAASIAQQRKLRATVTCPAAVLQQAGLTFTCTTVIDGKPKRYPFVVTETDGQGHVRYVGV